MMEEKTWRSGCDVVALHAHPHSAPSQQLSTRPETAGGRAPVSTEWGSFRSVGRTELPRVTRSRQVDWRRARTRLSPQTARLQCTMYLFVNHSNRVVQMGFIA